MSDRLPSRSLTIFALVALLAGGGLVFVGVVTRSGGGAVVLQADAAVSDHTPSTIAPASGSSLSSAGSPPSQASGPLPNGPSGSAATAGVFDDLAPRISAIPADTTRPRPVGLQTDTIDVARYPIRAIGLETDGQLEIPDETEIGWYRYGATAGQPGATVLAAHVSWNRTVGPFARLGALDPGAQIEVALDDGAVRRYEVTERALYGKLELPRDRIWRTTGEETLVLITCGGDFNPEVHRYDQNIVIYAVPIA